MKRITLILIACSLMILNACQRGPRGYDGLPGNANVKGSDPFTITTWQYSTPDKAYVASFTDVDITQAVADHGIVEIFLYYPDDQTWRNLPDIVAGSQFFFRYNKGGFDIYFANVDGTTPVSPASLGTGVWTFRSVVIAPSNKQAHPNTNWKNYNEAVQALNADANVTTIKSGLN